MSNTDVPLPEVYYAEKLKEHGAVPESVDTTAKGQSLRHELLRKALGDTFGKSILDVGCGYGAFRLRVLYADYTGVDVCTEMIAAAQAMDMAYRSADQCRGAKFEVRDIVSNPFPIKFDFVVASGLFQFNHGWGPVQCMIKAMWDHADKVAAFNMLSRKTQTQSWVNVEMHAWPERVLSECLELTPYVEIDHGYRDNDFTVILRRDPRLV